jgi:hypothetical protein
VQDVWLKREFPLNDNHQNLQKQHAKTFYKTAFVILLQI